jgi:molybdenum-dependent DNA-binding transcriptional regulator ModE
MKVKIGKRRPDITKDLLEDLYTKKKLSMHQAAKFLDTSYRTVWKKL